MTKTEHDEVVYRGAKPVEGFGPYQVKIGDEVTANFSRAVMLIEIFNKQDRQEIQRSN